LTRAYFSRDLENLSPNLSPARREALSSPPWNKSEASFGLPLKKGDGRGIYKGDGRGIKKRGRKGDLIGGRKGDLIGCRGTPKMVD